MAKNDALPKAKSDILPCLRQVLSRQTIDLAASMAADRFGAREQQECRAPFRGEEFFKKETTQND